MQKRDDAPAGLVEPIPAPFDRWAVLPCAPDGQALTPEVGDDGTVWAIHGTSELFMLHAIPLGVPDREDFVARFEKYQMRFVAFAGTEYQGPELQQLLIKLAGAFDADATDFDTVYRLDARSVYNMLTFRMFFLVADNRPRHILLCLAACESAVRLDVSTLEDLRARL